MTILILLLSLFNNLKNYKKNNLNSICASPGFTLIEVIAVILVAGISIYSIYTALIILHDRNKILNQQQYIRSHAQLFIEEVISHIDTRIDDRNFEYLKKRLESANPRSLWWTEDDPVRLFKIGLQKFDKNDELISIRIKISPDSGDKPSISLESDYYQEKKY
ncbi:MAG: type IV pilus modification PilV family protein [bacterium]